VPSRHFNFCLLAPRKQAYKYLGRWTVHFNKHIFFCTNQKDNNKKCCAQADANAAWEYAKHKVATAGLNFDNRVRVSKSGCLGRCEVGPCVVIYPEGVWYNYRDETDVEEIIEEHLKHDKIVPRLLIDKV